MEFKEIELFGGKFATLLPIEFSDMPEKYVRLKYPLEGRPQIIKTDKDCETDFKFSIIDIGSKQSATEQINQYVKRTVLCSNSSIEFIEDLLITDEDNNIARGFSFFNSVMDGIAYNAIFHKQFANQMMNISMSCPIAKSDMLLPYLKKCVLNMKFNNK